MSDEERKTERKSSFLLNNGVSASYQEEPSPSYVLNQQY